MQQPQPDNEADRRDWSSLPAPVLAAVARLINMDPKGIQAVLQLSEVCRTFHMHLLQVPLLLHTGVCWRSNAVLKSIALAPNAHRLHSINIYDIPDAPLHGGMFETATSLKALAMEGLRSSASTTARGQVPLLHTYEMKLQACVQLQHLVVERCGVSALMLPSCLVSLQLGFLPIASLPDVHCLPHLQSLSVHDCPHLSSLGLRLPQGLQKLRLAMLPLLVKLPQQLPQSLQHLGLYSCLGITRLPESICGLPHLEALDLAGCRSLQGLPLPLPSSLLELFAPTCVLDRMPEGWKPDALAVNMYW